MTYPAVAFWMIVANVVSNFTVAPARFDPLILTKVPAVVGPVNGEMLLVVGADTYVYPFVAVAEPPTVVTTTSTAPAAWAGADILIVVELVVIPVAATPPNVTVAPARFVPVMLTNVPAVVGPDTGEITVIVGADTYVYDCAVSVPPTVVTVTVTGPAA